jgi:AcrR family transcriptional regulator
VHGVPPTVKSPSTYRRQQAAATRERIAGAARKLFTVNGYGTTSIDAIAGEAGVGVRTVYSAFGTKREILSFICEQWLERARARERAGEVLAEADPVARLRAAAGWLRGLYEAGFDVVLIFDGAMDSGAETRELLQAKLAGRNHVMDAMIASLTGSLRVSLADAQATFRAFAASGVYRELVTDHGWSPDRFEGWLADTLVAQLL